MKANRPWRAPAVHWVRWMISSSRSTWHPWCRKISLQCHSSGSAGGWSGASGPSGRQQLSFASTAINRKDTTGRPTYGTFTLGTR